MDETSPVEAHGKGTVGHAQNGARLTFDVGHGLFSTASVDVGTRLLLRALAKDGWVGRSGRILDLGCGYGPIGVTLGALNPEARITMTDRDLLAVEFAAGNARRNDVEPERCLASLGYDELEPGDRFDLIASNVPAKVGPEAIRSLLLDGARHLTADGLMAIVVIDRIADEAERLVTDNAEVLIRSTSRGYRFLAYRPAGDVGAAGPAFDRGSYDRRRGGFEIGGRSFEADTVWGLPEFDTPGWSTALAGEQLLRARGDRVVVINPGQGLLPALLASTRPRASVELRGRDLLALRSSARNADGLARVETDLTLDHEVPDDVDVAVYQIPEQEPTPLTVAAVRALRGRPSVIVHGSANQLGRAAQALRQSTGERLKHRGAASLWFGSGSARGRRRRSSRAR